MDDLLTRLDNHAWATARLLAALIPYHRGQVVTLLRQLGHAAPRGSDPAQPCPAFPTPTARFC